MGSGDHNRTLLITYRKRDRATVRSLISCMIELAISTAIDTGKTEYLTLLLIDELAGLGEIPAMLTGAVERRKTNFRLICGMQDLNQIKNLDGQNRAASICNSFTNKLFLRASLKAVASGRVQPLPWVSAGRSAMKAWSCPRKSSLCLTLLAT